MEEGKEMSMPNDEARMTRTGGMTADYADYADGADFF
jgi:hypothetical protein